jgi:hypothetical protein
MGERRGTRTVLLAVGVVLLLAGAACDLLPTPAPTPDAATTEEEEVGGVTPTVPPSDETPAPDVTTEAGCALNGAFAADVTVPDGTEFPPGASFAKTWRLRNTGTCPWEVGTQLVFVSGDALGGPGSVPVGVVAPGTTTDVTVNLEAPTAPGTYKGNWQLQAPDLTHFGSVIYVQIVVPEAPTATPTPGPMCTPPACGPGEVLRCLGVCTGGCGVQCVTPTPPPGCVPPDPALEPILDWAEDLGYDLGCPTAPASSVYGVLQEFWTNVEDPNPHTHYRSLMIWRSDNREIYVIDGEDTDASEGRLLAYTDFYEDSQPEIHPDCAGMAPPSGYRLPERGFGKVWCENELWDQVGWPSERESAETLLLQPMQTGLLLRVTASGGAYLVALDYRAVWALTIMVP